ncbi:RcnB family protein [Lysobacter fragariae]
MNKHTLIAAALTAFVFSASPALADKHHKGGHEKSHKAYGHHDQGRHLGWYKQQWKRGDRVVWVDIEPRYYVDDYRAYRLSPPPEGYRWVQPMDDRYLLVEVATGLIAQALGY